MNVKELNIGDYVRTKYGIGKIDEARDFIGTFEIHLDSNKGRIHNVTDNTYWNNTEDIIKNRSNIIDLLEVGDILKLKNNKEYQQVECIKENELYLTGYIQFELQESKEELQEEIEWVITHEQIESMKYEV